MDFPSELEVEIEVPKGGFVKRRDDGGIDYVSPFPSPFNYGSVPGTTSGDGDRLDAVVLGARLVRGARTRVPVVACIEFEDAGLSDPKYICSHGPLSRSDEALVVRFFSFYALAKGLLNGLRGKSGRTRYLGLRVPPR